MKTYSKDKKTHENGGQSFFGPLYTKMTTPHIERCIVKCSGVCTIFFTTFIRYIKGMLYYAVIKSVLDTWDHFYTPTVLWAVKTCVKP